jgi:YhcH/YjgK/YiaL family protein
MIIDNLNNAKLYFNLHPGIETALRSLQSHELEGRGPGRYPSDRDDVYALIQEYVTRPPEQCKWEAHRKYMDVQIVTSGEEIIGYADIEELQSEIPYDETTDQEVFRGEGNMLRFRPGTFAIFFPGDAHMPAVESGKRASIRKIVIKVRI